MSEMVDGVVYVAGWFYIGILIFKAVEFAVNKWLRRYAGVGFSEWTIPTTTGLLNLTFWGVGVWHMPGWKPECPAWRWTAWIGPMELRMLKTDPKEPR